MHQQWIHVFVEKLHVLSVMMSDTRNIICNMKGTLGRICNVVKKLAHIVNIFFLVLQEILKFLREQYLLQLQERGAVLVEGATSF